MNNGIQSTVDHSNRKTVAGIILLTLGSILLLKSFCAFLIPHWIISWPMWLIAWGIYMGSKHQYRKNSWIVIVLLGLASLLNNSIPNAGSVVWPVFMIAIGLLIAFRPVKKPEYTFENPQEEGAIQ